MIPNGIVIPILCYQVGDFQLTNSLREAGKPQLIFLKTYKHLNECYCEAAAEEEKIIYCANKSCVCVFGKFNFKPGFGILILTLQNN